MNLVEFLEARIVEQEAALQGRNFTGDKSVGPSSRGNIAVPPSLTEALLAECAYKRGILANWKLAAEAEGITDPADAAGPVALARRSMLVILAAGYKEHPDYQEDWEARAEPNSAGSS